jgi:esterase/lipase
MHRVVPRSQWPPTNRSAVDPEAAALWLTYPAYPTRSAAELLRLSRQAYQQAATLSVPALVIHSRTDETVHPDSGPLLARALSGRLLWLERSRHNALLDGERDRIHEAILGHLG